MAVVSSCPDGKKLQRFLLGQLPGPVALDLERHVEACTRCSGLLRKVPADDTLVAAMRGHTRNELSANDQALVEKLILRLRKYGPAACGETASEGNTQGVARVSEVMAAKSVMIPGYSILGELGRGGMGVVYRAQQTGLKRVVALKMILGGAVGTHERERFRAESEAVARLQHPNIVQIYEVGEWEGLPYFSLEYCEGGSLAQKLRGTPLPPREAATLVEALARAIQAAHECHVIHRDLKPANVLLTAAGVPKISDFGLAKKMDDSAALTQSGDIVGTPSYMAPEQALGRTRELGPAADIYALGAIHYELLTGRPPFKAANAMETLLQVASEDPVPPSRLQPKLPRDLETVCLKCLERSPTRRYASALALAEDLRRYLNSEPIEARPAGWRERVWKLARRRPAVAALGVVVGAALLTMLVGWLYFTIQLEGQRNLAVSRKIKAEESEAEAKGQEKEVQRQKEVVELERKHALDGEAEARRQLDAARRSLMTAQVWRVAGVLDRDPLQGFTLLEDRKSCPPELRDFAWGYYHAQCQQWRPVTLTGHSKGVTWVAVAPDGKYLASSSDDGTIKIWDLPGCEERRTLRGHEAGVNAVAFSPDGTLLASASHDKRVKLWDPATGNVVATLEGHTGQVTSVAFSPDGKWLVSGSKILHDKATNPDARYHDGEVRLWNVAERKQERLLMPRQDTAITCVAFAPNGQTVAAGTSQRSDVRLIDVASAKVVDRFTAGPGWVYRVAYSPDGRTLAWSTAQQLIHVRDVDGRTTRLTLRGHQSDVDGLAWSPDGATLASGSSDGKIKLWDAATGRERLSLHGVRAAIESMVFSPDASTLFVAHSNNRIMVWRVRPQPDWASLSGPSGFAAVAVSSDSQSVVAATREKTLKVWSLASRKSQTLNLGENFGTALVFAPNGKFFAVGVQGYDSTGRKLLPSGDCRLWEPGSTRPTIILDHANQAVNAVAFTPDGTRLLTGDGVGKLRIWDVAERKELALLGTHRAGILAIAVSLDGKTAASSAEGEIKVWDLESRTEKAILSGHRGSIRGLAFFDDGKTLVSGGTDRLIKIWDVATGKPRNLPPQPDAILSLAGFAPTGTLAIGCQDRTVRLLDLASGQLRAILSGHTREVAGVVFSSDGKLLISACAANSHWYVKGGEIKVWKAD